METKNRFDSYDFILLTKTERDGWRRREEEGKKENRKKKKVTSPAIPGILVGHMR